MRYGQGPVTVENVDRGLVLAREARWAKGFWARGRGLLGCAGLGEGEGLVLTPCSSIHTWGMRFALDVLCLDAQGRTLAVCSHLRPWRLGPLRRGTRTVVELPAGAAGPTRPGDRILCTPSALSRGTR